MSYTEAAPLGVRAAGDIGYRPDRASPYRARVRWFEPVSRRRRSLSEGKETHDEAEDWIAGILKAAEAGIAPNVATMPLAEYSTATMDLALRGPEPKTLDTLDPYLAGWRRRVVPALGHFPVRIITYRAVDRAVHGWIADEQGRSTVKNSLAGRRRQAAWSPTDPQPVPRNDGKAVPDYSDTASDLRKRWSGRQDLNLRPLDPQSSALPSCATSRSRALFGLPAGRAEATLPHSRGRSDRLAGGRAGCRGESGDERRTT
ncbi:hypothetical protein GCM10010232_15980 [Streptomyces amakusaensis]